MKTVVRASHLRIGGLQGRLCQMIVLTALLTLVAAKTATAQANPSLFFTPKSVSLSGLPGETFTVSGSIGNSSSTDLLIIDGFFSSLTPGVTATNDGFLNLLLPYFDEDPSSPTFEHVVLQPNTIISGQFFDFSIAPDASPGERLGVYRVDAHDSKGDFDVQQYWSVRVQPAAVPESSTLVVFGTGLGVLGCVGLLRRWRHFKPKRVRPDC